MDEIVQPVSRPLGQAVSLICRDGVILHSHIWPAQGDVIARVIINPATGVLARYYHYYADFLAGEGFEVLTYDYRGIGLSRPADLRGCGYRWRDWGEQDFDAALRFMSGRDPALSLMVVGHSIGGYLPGLSSQAHRIDRMLTVGAQYAWWRDYATGHRLKLFWRWHVVMQIAGGLHGRRAGRWRRRASRRCPARSRRATASRIGRTGKLSPRDSLHSRWRRAALRETDRAPAPRAHPRRRS